LFQLRGTAVYNVVKKIYVSKPAQVRITKNEEKNLYRMFPKYMASPWFMYDDAPTYFSKTVSICLNHKYPGHWVSRGKPVARPTRSPDLNMLQFYL